MHRDEQSVVLTVYFSGTGHFIEDTSNLGGYLYANTNEDDRHIKIGFNGCQVDYGTKGLIFGTGLEEQCKQVVDTVIALLKQGKRVVLNGYGHSRGAIACLLLAKMLGNFDKDLVEVNLTLMDPVPGNLLITSKIDLMSLSLARQTMDVSKCRNLNNVLTVYPNKPLPYFSFHAPLVPKYPPRCKVKDEIVPGCHSGAQTTNFKSPDSGITFNLISRFLNKLGTLWKWKLNIEKKDQLLDRYNQVIRSKHSRDKVRGCHATSPVKIKTRYSDKAPYLSPSHEKLTKKYSDVIQENPNKKYVYSFFPENFRKNHKAKKDNDRSLAEKNELFIEFLDEIYHSGLSKKSKKTTKGSLIQSLKESVRKQPALSERDLKDTIRNLLAICLQRDRNAYTPSLTTSSASKATKLLNSKKYRALTNIILNIPNKNLSYSDLLIFVLGENNKTYFKAKNSRQMYAFFGGVNASSEKSPLLTNNISFLLRAKK